MSSEPDLIKKGIMTLSELVQLARTKKDDAFGNIHENRVNTILQTVLDELLEQIESIKEGEIELSGFGKFIIKKIPSQKSDTTTTQRRIIFRKERKIHQSLKNAGRG